MIELRLATDDDASLLFEWANDAETRRMSFSTDPIPWDTHVAWLAKKVADPTCRFFVGVEDGAPVGFVRFDAKADDTAIISLAVAPSQRGNRLATPLIEAGLAAMPDVIAIVEAEIKHENARSMRAFERAGFVEQERRADRVLCVWRRTGL